MRRIDCDNESQVYTAANRLGKNMLHTCVKNNTFNAARPSDRNRPFDAGHGVAADPDCSTLPESNGNPSIATKTTALPRRIVAARN